MSKSLSHLNENNQPTMVDVSKKESTSRLAIARSILKVSNELFSFIQNGDLQSPKGPVFHTAIIAGTMAAKKTGDLIPFCHPIGLDSCKIHIEFTDQNNIVIYCTCEVIAKTGIEMEALTGASVAALTVYDMCKAFGSEMVILETRLIKKTGGKKDYKYNDPIES